MCSMIYYKSLSGLGRIGRFNFLILDIPIQKGKLGRQLIKAIIKKKKK